MVGGLEYLLGTWLLRDWLILDTRASGELVFSRDLQFFEFKYLSKGRIEVVLEHIGVSVIHLKDNWYLEIY